MYLSFSVENMVTVGIMLAAWMILLHIVGQGFQHMQSG
jgi:hypothetical protein